MNHHHELPEQPPAEFWEGFYAEDQPWTGKVNAVLAGELTERPAPGASALDVGCGTGADAIWLARLGWSTTGVDIAEAALVRARIAAREAGAVVRWVRADLEADFPEGTWDLVTSSYLHSPVPLAREAVLRRACEAVAPGGTFVVVVHLSGPSWADPGDHAHDHLPPLAATEAVLREAGLRVVSSAEIERSAPAPDGTPGTRRDGVVRAVRAVG